MTSTAEAPPGSGGSTFFWPMVLLPRAKRGAIFAVYGFCRAVDDVADEPGDPAAKRAELAAWRERIDRLYRDPGAEGSSPLGRAVARYALPRAELEAILDGVAMDVHGPIRAPDLDRLRLYCRRVAGAVGMLAVRIFDRADPETEAFAVALGEALQLTNILRDLDEDAAMGRLYLPRELLDAAGIGASDPRAVLADPRLGAACDALADLAEARFAEAGALLARWPARRLWSARAMMVLYRRVLDRLRARGWGPPRARPRLGRTAAAWATLRCLAGRQPPR
jgi:phytoene synthase